MGQAGRGARFLMESLHHLAVMREIGAQDLERHLAIHSDLKGAIDGSHSAFTESRDDRKALDPTTNQRIDLGVWQLAFIDQDGSVVRTEQLALCLAGTLAYRADERLWPQLIQRGTCSQTLSHHPATSYRLREAAFNVP